MAYCRRPAHPHDVYVRFGSYSGLERPAQVAQYQQMQQRPDQMQQGLNSVPQIDMSQAAPPPMMDNRFANAPPPNNLPHMAAANMTAEQTQRQTRVLSMNSAQLYELLANPQHHYTKEGKPTKIMVKVYTDWCGPCQKIAPRFDEMSMNPQFNDVLFVSIDGEKIGPELKPFISVSAVPVFFTFYCGRQLNMIPGADLGAITQACHECCQYSSK